MNITQSFIRVLFTLLSLFLGVSFAVDLFPGHYFPLTAAIGSICGIAFAAVFIAAAGFIERFNLRTMNIAILGLFFGYLLGWAFVSILESVFQVAAIAVPESTMSLIRGGIFLVSVYTGMILSAVSAEEIHLSIPYVKFETVNQKKKDVLLDFSALCDTRIIDLASSGLLDSHMIIPSFMLKALQKQIEDSDEGLKSKARRALDVIKRLENISGLDLRYNDTDFPEVKDPQQKVIRLARLLDANVVTSDMNRIQQSAIESVDGIRVINIHVLSNALKPLTQSGEVIDIKIQRYGKEPRQGVGYLEDGTMVVVNGGADYIGETIKGQVLSVKHTSSGRMIFCNAAEEEMDDDDRVPTHDDHLQERQRSSYYTV